MGRVGRGGWGEVLGVDGEGLVRRGREDGRWEVVLVVVVWRTGGGGGRT